MEKVMIDYREAPIFPYLAGKLEFTKENLVVGDFLFFFKDNHKICIERKTWKDLWSSIVDGRFREQRSRLFEWKNEYSHVIYVLEGNAKDVDKNEETCHRALHRLSLVYGFCVWKTPTIQDTADYIVWLSRQETLFQESDPIQDQITNLSQSMVKKKKDVRTSRNYLVAFLQSLSGISYDMADQIANQHQDINHFIEELKKDNVENFAKKIYKTKNGKDRKIGKEKSKLVYQILGIGSETS